MYFNKEDECFQLQECLQACKAGVRKVCPTTPAFFSTPADPNRCKYFYYAFDISKFLYFQSLCLHSRYILLVNPTTED